MQWTRYIFRFPIVPVVQYIFSMWQGGIWEINEREVHCISCVHYYLDSCLEAYSDTLLYNTSWFFSPHRACHFRMSSTVKANVKVGCSFCAMPQVMLPSLVAQILKGKPNANLWPFPVWWANHQEAFWDPWGPVEASVGFRRPARSLRKPLPVCLSNQGN